MEGQEAHRKVLNIGVRGGGGGADMSGGKGVGSYVLNALYIMHDLILINPQRACAEALSLSVCLFVCLSVCNA